MYKRKTRDEYQIWQYWGTWEEVSAADNWKEARALLRDYRANQPEAACKVIKRRVALPPRYKVALPGDRWKRGFATVEEASAYASQLHQRSGVFVAVEVDA